MTIYRAFCEVYQFNPTPVNHSAPLFDTLDDRRVTALNRSEFATGCQQRVLNSYSETNFTCPSYWLAEAFSENNKQSWKYQYPITPIFHMPISQLTSLSTPLSLYRLPFPRSQRYGATST
jgi:carboxylesterase type B